MANHDRFKRRLRTLVLIGASFGVVAFIFLWWFRPRSFDESEPPPAFVMDYERPFEWSNAIPNLYQAASLPHEEAVRSLLQNITHLRTYVAIELKASAGSSARESKSTDPIYDAKLGDPILETAITSNIDVVIRKRRDSRGTMTSVDYPLPRQPFPFTTIVALKSHVSPYASLVFELPKGNRLTAEQTEAKYGAPQETTMDAQSFVLIIYLTETKSYTAKTSFRIDPDSREVRRVSISLQRHTR